MTSTILTPAGLVAGTWTIDTTHSEVSFAVRHMGLFKVRGGFATFQGSITVDPEIEKSSAYVEVDMASINTREPNRDGHLRSPDFFDVEKYPTMTFQGSGVRLDGETIVLVGDLTVRDVTRPFELSVEPTGVLRDLMGKQRAGFVARGTLRRGDFGITFNMPLEGTGVMIGDKVEVNIEIQVVLNDEEPASES